MKYAVLSLLGLFSIGFVQADVVDDIDRCARIDDATARLACYDQNYASLRAQLVTVRQLFSSTANNAAAVSNSVRESVGQAAGQVSPSVNNTVQRTVPSVNEIVRQPAKSKTFLERLFGSKEEVANSEEVVVAEEEQSGEDLFGSDREKFGDDVLVTKARALPKIEELTARVIEAERKGFGNWKITLDNGQIWYENEATNKGKFKPGDTVVIKRSKFSSAFFMENKSGGRTINVRRIK